MTPHLDESKPNSSFELALATALEIAVTSPSSHNCQPWALARLQPDSLLLASDGDRELRALPAHRAEMRISCGLFWRLLTLALAAQGWTAETAPTPVQSGRCTLPITWTPLRLARFHCDGGRRGSLDELRSTARKRRTNRGPYSERPVHAAILGDLGALGADGEPPIRIRHLFAARDRKLFADFVARHGGRDFADRAAWRETHSFIRRSDTEAQLRGDGFTFPTLFGPLSTGSQLLRRVALAPTTVSALRLVGFPRILSGQLAAVVRRSPVIVAMSLPDFAHAHTDADLLAAGGVLADYWLRATELGLVLHPISIVIQHEDLRRKLQAALDLPGRVCFVARLGYPTAQFPATPRRTPTASLRML